MKKSSKIIHLKKFSHVFTRWHTSCIMLLAFRKNGARRKLKLTLGVKIMNTIIILIAIAIVVRTLLVIKQRPRNVKVVPYIPAVRRESFREVAADRSRRYW